MIGLVIVTHGHLATEFVAAMEHVVGPQANTRAICIGPDDDMEERRKEILAAVGAVDTGDGVILLTDMFGGTPSNLAISVMEQANVEVIAGINLPMLIKLASVRNDAKLAEAAAMAQESGRKYINIASELLANDT
ncbi:PTS sugar transporter subunit IIA [Pyruvatibacter mobilis]|jgi:PTS system mannose-specific IIA component|uniref:PTS fructose transporter subunit IIA n=1 Tax=Pyruvatibacter mobilis TaxID=1712261 RepID=A0A845Q858_9HYPH|nr:PTS sugar transporter subunit IIA [Pyruvatibacter mobilis]NBG94835.1 PTS fructose transporter subunit IIA [Pyruvatibacter mobilis]QJD76056.1 PTS sugar transporter subunit IIA [Pyruvatibacter mobilis]GGD20776.1 PTS fructose transporter subunit IIA [Pyruvatibacter mobilis]